MGTKKYTTYNGIQVNRHGYGMGNDVDFNVMNIFSTVLLNVSVTLYLR